MNKDRIDGAAKEAVGSIKQEVGKLVGDSKMVRQGVVLEAKGKIDIAIADVKDALKS